MKFINLFDDQGNIWFRFFVDKNNIIKKIFYCDDEIYELKEGWRINKLPNYFDIIFKEKIGIISWSRIWEESIKKHILLEILNKNCSKP